MAGLFISNERASFTAHAPLCGRVMVPFHIGKDTPAFSPLMQTIWMKDVIKENSGPPALGSWGLCLTQSPQYGSHETEIFPGLPWWSEVKNPPASAGETGSIPGPGKIPQPEQLKPMCHSYAEPVLHNHSHHNEKPAPHTIRRSPSLAGTRENSCAAAKTQNAAKDL